MTVSGAKKKEKSRHSEIPALFVSVLFTALIFIAAVFFSDELSRYVASGLGLSVGVIIPSVFPFLILTDVAMRYIHFERIGLLRRIFERLFHINGSALSVFVCGILCGFPLGARLAVMMYENGKISKCECERLMAFTNNASPGYVICAVGLAMRGSLSEGIALYISMITASIITGVLIGVNKNKSNIPHYISKQNYYFSESVKSAITVCLHVSGFVTVFSIAVGLIDELVPWEIVKAFIIPFFEIGNAAIFLSDLYILPKWATLALTAFSISFSGLCVSAQTLSLVDKGCDISVRGYVGRKLLQGLIAAALITVFYIIKNPW